MGLFWCALNELHWFISYGFNLGDNLQDTGSLRVNVSDRLVGFDITVLVDCSTRVVLMIAIVVSTVPIKGEVV